MSREFGKGTSYYFFPSPSITNHRLWRYRISLEVVFVDDSTDDTAEVIRDLQDRFSFPINLISRPPERRKNGLGGAVVEGLKVAQAPWVCVMDADLQHPPEFVPEMLRHAQKSGSDIVVGSRLATGGNASSLGFRRTIVSHVFAMTTRVTFPQRLRNVTDPLTGFFILRHAAVNPDDLHPDGFKILLETLVSHPDLIVSEIPFQFGYRNAGESKASIRETIRFFRGLFRLRLAGSGNFIRFLVVGLSGLIVNTVALAAFTEFAAFNLLLSALLATQASTLWNFGLTETWVFRKRTTEQPLLQRLARFLVDQQSSIAPQRANVSLHGHPVRCPLPDVQPHIARYINNASLPCG